MKAFAKCSALSLASSLVLVFLAFMKMEYSGLQGGGGYFIYLVYLTEVLVFIFSVYQVKSEFRNLNLLLFGFQLV